MNRVSDERLDELVRRHERDQGQPVHRDIAAALRELRDYRKAVREYLSAVDVCNKLKGHSGTTPFAEYDALYARQTAEATLRALKESDE